MRTAAKTITSGVTAIVLLVGCAGGSDSANEPAPSSDPVVSAESPTDDSVAPIDSAVEPVESAPAETSPPATDAPVPTDPPLIEGVDGIELLTLPADAGTQPELAWAPIDTAATYRVVVLDADGAPYWSWSGPETSVFLGGGESSEGAGPSVSAGFTWTVTAFDADNGFLAASAIGTLAT